MIENVDYKIVLFDDTSALVNIELLSGKYAGIIVSCGNTFIEEDEEKDEAYLKFQYDIVDAKNSNLLESQTTDEIKDSLEFKNVVGDVLVEMLAKAMESCDETKVEEETSDF